MKPGQSESINKKIMWQLITLLYKYDDRTTFPAQCTTIWVLEILAHWHAPRCSSAQSTRNKPRNPWAQECPPLDYKTYQ